MKQQSVEDKIRRRRITAQAFADTFELFDPAGLDPILNVILIATATGDLDDASARILMGARAAEVADRELYVRRPEELEATAQAQIFGEIHYAEALYRTRASIEAPAELAAEEKALVEDALETFRDRLAAEGTPQPARLVDELLGRFEDAGRVTLWG